MSDHGSVPTTTAEFRVGGMDCASCVGAIEAALGALNGVQSVRVDLATATVRAEYDTAAVSEALLATQLERLGFGAGEDAGETGQPLIPQALVLAAIGLALPLMVLFRDYAGYTPDALYVPGGLDTGRFDQVSLLPIGLAFLLGVLVFFSPAMLAMSSMVVGYTAGAGDHSRWRALKLAAGFAAGIVIVDAAVGAAFGAGGREAIRFFTGRLPAWNLLVGLTLLVTGLTLLRVVTFPLPPLAPRMREARGFGGAMLVGAPFGFLDCPGCTPLLLPVALGAAATGEPLYGAAVLGAYGLGRGVLLMSLGAPTGLARQLRGLRRHTAVIEAASGAILLGGGLYFLKEFLRMTSIAGL